MIGRTATMAVRLTPAEKKTAEQLARRDLLSTSEWVRRAIRQDARTAGLWPPPEVEKRHN